jgi:hypothetical protein
MIMRQKLLTAAIRKALPKLYATDNVPLADKIVQVKLFHPYGRGTWFITEFDGEDTMFGAIDLGMTSEPEWGYISLSELESLKGPGGVQAIERDAHFPPTKWSVVRSGKVS